MKTNRNVWAYLAHFFLEWEKFQANILEKFKTHILGSITFFFRKLCRLWHNVDKYFRDTQAQMAIWHKRIACWIPKATNTHSEYLLLIVFLLQQWLQERATILRNTYIAYLVCPFYSRSCPYSFLHIFTLKQFWSFEDCLHLLDPVINRTRCVCVRACLQHVTPQGFL